VKHGAACIPQQVHLAYAGAAAGTGMTVSWATDSQVRDSSVWIGSSVDALKLVNAAVSQVSYYQDATNTMFHHHTTLSGLTPHTKYFYKVGSKSNAAYTSAVHSFVTARAATDTRTFKMVTYGDFGPGAQSKHTLAYVNTLTSDTVDFILHIGDVGYADDAWLMPGQSLGFFYEKVYNQWMNSLAPVMSSVPYMVVVGNHEAECHSPACQVSPAKAKTLGNYTAYNARFKMPYEEAGGALNMWYSFEHGPVHFTAISSETDYPGAPENKHTAFSHNGKFGNQLAWVEADLENAAANRATVPWIVVAMHRPIYDLNSVRNGAPAGESARLQAAFEALFLKYKVDVVLTAHEHCYQRHTPIRSNQPVLAGVSSDHQTYDNPHVPVYILSGAGGAVEGHEAKTRNTAKWNVVSNYVDFGVSTLEASSSMLSWTFLSSSSLAVLDEFVILKTS